MIPDRKAFQQHISGRQTDLFILTNSKKMQAAITNYGGRLVSLLVPDTSGQMVDVITGYDSLEGYQEKDDPYFGAIIGRYGNRIAKGKFTLEGKEYHLEINNGPNALHGGSGGFSAKVWDARQLDGQTLELSYLSKDGEEGYPGNLQVKVTYSLTDDNGLKIDYQAVTDKTTVINLTNHAYFNLDGEGKGTVLGQHLQLNADQFVPIDENSIPFGFLEETVGTPFDFKEETLIGMRINEDNQQLKNGNGYDHTFVLNHPPKTLGLCGIAKSYETGIVMEVLTTEPGVQLYTGNFVDVNNGKGGKAYRQRSAFCLETQHFPDSPNQQAFPDTSLRSGETFRSTTIYRFSTLL